MSPDGIAQGWPDSARARGARLGSVGRGRVRAAVQSERAALQVPLVEATTRRRWPTGAPIISTRSAGSSVRRLRPRSLACGGVYGRERLPDHPPIRRGDLRACLGMLTISVRLKPVAILCCTPARWSCAALWEPPTPAWIASRSFPSAAVSFQNKNPRAQAVRPEPIRTGSSSSIMPTIPQFPRLRQVASASQLRTSRRATASTSYAPGCQQSRLAHQVLATDWGRPGRALHNNDAANERARLRDTAGPGLATRRLRDRQSSRMSSLSAGTFGPGSP